MNRYLCVITSWGIIKMESLNTQWTIYNKQIVSIIYSSSFNKLNIISSSKFYNFYTLEKRVS